MGRMTTIILAGAGLSGALFVTQLPLWWLPAGLAAAGCIIWTAVACRHPHATLQPARRESDGSAVPARWMCSECGHTWVANFEKAQTPVVRYAGFDQAKAAEAAKRAKELELRTRELAIDRAGLSTPATSHVVLHHHGAARRAS